MGAVRRAEGVAWRGWAGCVVVSSFVELSSALLWGGQRPLPRSLSSQPRRSTAQYITVYTACHILLVEKLLLYKPLVVVSIRCCICVAGVKSMQPHLLT